MRRYLKALLILIIGLPVIAAGGYWYLQQQIANAGISHLQLDFNRLTLHNASLARVRFQLAQQGAVHQFDLQNVELKWHWPQFFKPALQHATLGPGYITVGSHNSPPVNQDVALKLPNQWQLPDWLPKHIGLTDTRLIMPCPSGQCPLLINGYFTYHAKADANVPTTGNTDAYWQSQLTITDYQTAVPQAPELVIDINYQATPQPALELSMQQDQQIGLSLKQHINPASQLAVTELMLALSPPSPANQALLQHWGIDLPPNWLAQFQQPLQFYSKLSWQLVANSDLSRLLSHHDVDGIAIVRMPDPFLVPELGLVQGELNAQLKIKDQVVEHWQLSAKGTLTEIVMPTVINNVGLSLNPLQFAVSSTTTAPLNLEALPLQLNLSSSGDNSFSLDSELTINGSAGTRVDIKTAKLTAALARLSLADKAITLTNLQLNTELSGHWQANNWQLSAPGSSIVSGAIQTDTVSASHFSVTANNSRFTATNAGVGNLRSELNAALSDVKQAQIIQQNWQWQGLLSGIPAELKLEGQVSNDAGLTIVHQLVYQPAAQATLLNWQMPETFLLAGNPFAATFNDWPELLTLNKGKLAASGTVTVDGNNLKSSNQLQLGDVGGIYDRSLFSGLNATMDFTLADNQLQLHTNNFKLNRLNHGFELGPLTLSASATVPLATPEQSTLSLQRVELQAMNGLISANNQQLDFSKDANLLVLDLTQIDLASLLKQHPSGDLTGNGKLSGTVPITISNQGVSVSNGSIAAEAPGGSLQYRSDSASAMAKTNSNMKLVFDALDNFQYSVLSSEISYDTSGKLILGLTLQGSNPNMQQGRAINLNVNLEEDLPALITSLQLTNKLNDVITKRVQQYLQRQQAAAAVNGEKQ